jgi:hypothetical protein
MIRLPPIAVTVCCLWVMACGASTGAVDRRVFILGDSEIVMADPEVKSAGAGLKLETPVQWDTSSHLMECGSVLMDIFISAVAREFHSSVRDSHCSATSSKAECLSDYLPKPFESTYLRLDYRCLTGKCRLELNCTQLRENASPISCGISESAWAKYLTLWDNLRAGSKSCVR